MVFRLLWWLFRPLCCHSGTLYQYAYQYKGCKSEKPMFDLKTQSGIKDEGAYLCWGKFKVTGYMERKKVLITGAASGIGRATAIRFANEGYDVCLNDVQAEKLASVMTELSKGNHLVVEGSYAEKKTMLEGEKIIQKNWGELDVLVNCAGIFKKTDAVGMDIQQWRVVFDTM